MVKFQKNMFIQSVTVAALQCSTTTVTEFFTEITDFLKKLLQKNRYCSTTRCSSWKWQKYWIRRKNRCR